MSFKKNCKKEESGMTDWFEEKLEVSAGRIFKFEYKRLVESFTSKFQKIDIYDSKPFGKVLVHDDVIMATEFDEAHYHEMLVHVPFNVYPRPENVLIIGGGDGGTLRECLKHHDIKTVHVCEIDEDVIRLCKKHFPTLSSSFEDPRVTVFCQDGAEFVKQYKDFYQVILVDSSDPIGPAEVLFQESFYKSMKDALTKDGIIVSQSESFMYHQPVIKKMAAFCKRLFPVYRYYYTLVPTYPSGVIGFSFCSKKYDPIEHFMLHKAQSMPDLKYYNADIHVAAFALPQAVKSIF
jgi:spermidine synthase